MNRDSMVRFFKELKEKPYALPVYSLTTVAVTLPLIFGVDLCLMNVLAGMMAILVPYKIYGDKDLKKVFYSGALAIVIISLIGSVYHVHILYGQEVEVLESEHLEGYLDILYGRGDTVFEGTVSIKGEVDVNQVFLNLTYQSPDDPMKEDTISYELAPDGDLYGNSIVTDREAIFNHHFALNYSEGNETFWEETDGSFGPVTLSRGNTFVSIMIIRSIVPFLFFLPLLGLLWWLGYMRKSKEVGKDVLEEKESRLEHYCDSCGEDLSKEMKVCPRCGEELED